MSSRLSTGGLFFGVGWDLLDQGKLQLVLHRINAIQNDTHCIANGNPMAADATKDLTTVLIEPVMISLQRSQWHQTLHEQIIEFYKKSKLGDVENDSGKLLTDMVLHEANFLPFDQLSLRIRCPALALAHFLRDGRKFLLLHRWLNAGLDAGVDMALLSRSIRRR